jgi:hypothetical protein
LGPRRGTPSRSTSPWKMEPVRLRRSRGLRWGLGSDDLGGDRGNRSRGLRWGLGSNDLGGDRLPLRRSALIGLPWLELRGRNLRGFDLGRRSLLGRHLRRLSLRSARRRGRWCRLRRARSRRFGRDDLGRRWLRHDLLRSLVRLRTQRRRRGSRGRPRHELLDRRSGGPASAGRRLPLFVARGRVSHGQDIPADQWGPAFVARRPGGGELPTPGTSDLRPCRTGSSEGSRPVQANHMGPGRATVVLKDVAPGHRRPACFARFTAAGDHAAPRTEDGDVRSVLWRHVPRPRLSVLPMSDSAEIGGEL